MLNVLKSKRAQQKRSFTEKVLELTFLSVNAQGKSLNTCPNQFKRKLEHKKNEKARIGKHQHGKEVQS